MTNEKGQALVTLRPNMFIENADIRQSTWHKNSFAGSFITKSDLSYCQLIDIQMNESTFARASMNNVRILQCSLKNVYIESSDMENFFINGKRIDEVLKKLEEKELN
ncbi:pentapeptide repeat-containing protein [Bacillus thuringiensis]|uniref:pentapeptide repeat-containing protein n=1 Tax=Bacillus thuringiensis TaxID=1428 RepID=UPI000BF918FD|nr:pentapeptide repeat-containing protein [Bacillus thuringiensis]PFB88609.1 hypothetical protein CN283_11920 [Bacillus thuringiensis]PGN40731.1 hypothetical protein CN968_17030 [Bacillus thuringiensis]